MVETVGVRPQAADKAPPLADAPSFWVTLVPLALFLTLAALPALWGRLRRSS
jgi:hypothetical protein